MKQPSWPRRRRTEDAPDPSADGSRPDAPRHDPAVDEPDQVLARLRDLEAPPAPPRHDDGGAPGREAAYAAWADRIRTHRDEKLAGLAPEPAADEPARPAPSPHWDSSLLFVATPEEEAADPSLMGTRELLAVLALEDGATVRDVQSAFRRLAKEHHPDRWQAAPAHERAVHEEQMSLIVSVQKELRRRLE